MFMVISWLTLVTIYTLSLTYLWNWSFILTYGIAAQFLDWVTVLGTRESNREIQNSKSKNHFYYIYSNMHIDATYTFIFICMYINTHSHDGWKHMYGCTAHTYMHVHKHTHILLATMSSLSLTTWWQFTRCLIEVIQREEAPWDTLSNMTLKTSTHISLFWRLSI